MDISQIQKRIDIIDKLVEENRYSQEMLNSELECDANYLDAVAKAKEVNTKKKNLKEAIYEKGSNKELVEKIKSNKEEIAVNKDLLAHELAKLYVNNNTSEIQDNSGDNRKFKINISLSPKRLTS
ncbi:MAG: hypothetical protein ACD_58C00287G0006 [uncultured bacterium]|nr:MAG: hypothetical protein ACD_58C00287G0006 [uncultured bacterium]